jgi:hypothetical protein
MRAIMKTRTLILALVASAVAPQYATAQLDPLLFLKPGHQPGANTNGQPNVIVMVDTANRMQRDQDNNYRDNNAYPRSGALYEATLGVSAGNTTAKYRRKYINLVNTDNGGGSDKFTADRITVVRDQEAEYANVPTVIKDPATGLFQISGFDARTKMNVAKISIAEAILRNTAVARFGLIKMRQNNPAVSQNAAAGNIEPVVVSDAGQQLNTDSGGVGGKWKITRPTVSASNGSVGAPATVTVVATDAANSNSTILTTLGKATGAAGSLIPAGADSRTVVDAPVDNMLDDAKTEAARLINADTQCRNTIVVLVVAGAEGQSTNEDPTAKASQFLNVALNHRVPVYVIAIVPAAADRAQLQAIAANSGGLYTEITKAMIDATTAGQPVPEFVKVINTAVQHGYASQADFDTAPTATLPYGPTTEFQVTSPIVGTVDLTNAADINGVALPNTNISNPATNVHVPQRSNLLVTTAFTLPGFDGSLRGFRTYKPVADSTKSVGYKFVQDGTRLWVACAPGTTTSGPCASLAAGQRNIYTVLPNGQTVSFDPANAATLQPYLNTTDAASLINTVRALPLGAMVDSTPAIMDPPSLDPPPDADYPGFADTNADRRSIVWIGANDGMFHAIDARLGIEVWAYIPFNLLPKLYTLQSGQPVGDVRFFVDGSPKIADVKIDGTWRTYLVFGEGPGGTFYQTFDVTMDDMVNSVTTGSDDITQVLAYFQNPSRIVLKWAFPSYSSFDKSLTLARQGLADCVTAGSADITGPGCKPWGDIAANASAVEKSVGETWSDPAVGEITNNLGGYAVLTGSGFLKYNIQQQANRAGAVAGTTFYMIDVKTGAVFDSKSVGSDGLAENVDSCAAANDCMRMKNALQADVVATGPPDSRYITKAYVGDLDGRIWRFDITLNAGLPKIVATSPTKLYDAGAAQPMFGSMASVTVGSTQQYLFQGTGSDLLPSNGVSQAYGLLVVLDNGATGSLTGSITLGKVDGANDDEKVTGFPAVAGDIVFFTTTSFFPATFCGNNMTANLYAFTYIGGAAYDTNNSGSITSADSTKVSSTAGARATAPFVADQHLGISVGGKVQMFGDPNDYNNGVGQVGVRILSWREVR